MSSKSDSVCSFRNYEQICPVLNAHDKIEECDYFLFQMIRYYHISRLFRFYLNAFVKSFREITFMLQTYKNVIPGFSNWYAKKQEEFKNDRLLKWLSNSRTKVVHQDMLKTKSKLEAGVYRGRKLKLAIVVPVDNPFVDSTYMLERIKLFGFVDDAHSAIGEQYGIRRQWCCEGLNDDDELVKVCLHGIKCMQQLMKEVHLMMGLKYDYCTLKEEMIEDNFVLLETDVDPSLTKKWGWE